MSIFTLKQKGVGCLLLSFFCFGFFPSSALAQSACNSMDFTDVTLSVGISHQYSLPVGTDFPPMHGGAVAEDFNGDGWLDLYVVQGFGGPNLLYINDQLGGFTDEAAARSADIQAASVAASAADFDNDGDMDIAVSIVDGQSRVLINDGAGNFTSEIVLPNSTSATTSSSWGDVDNDGLLELAIGQWDPNDQSFFLYKNEGGTTLTEYEFRNVPRTEILVFSPRFADINGDRLADLHIVADSSQSQLYLNSGGGMFDNVTGVNGTGGAAGGQSEMGHAVGDFDYDGDLDLFTSNIFDSGGNRLYVNDGSGVFSQAADAAGAANGAWGWGASFGDLDNDGNLDLYHVNGWHTTQSHINTPARLFLNQGDNTFIDEASCANAGDPGQGKGMLQFDYDNDGDLDIFIVNSQDMAVVGEQFPGTPVLLRNDTSNGNSWLKVTLDAAPPLHRNGIGSRVLVRMGATTMMHEMNASSNFLSQNPGSIAHFGLGSALIADDITAEWVTGDKTVLFNVGADQQVSLTSPIATVSAREVDLNEFVTADASLVGSPVEWEIEGAVYADPVTISFDSEGAREFILNVFDVTQTTIVRREILLVEVTSGPVILPEITSPIPGSTLTGDTETFNWTENGAVVSDWQLLVGTSVGDNSLFDSGVLASTVLSQTVGGLPADGSTVNVRLQYTISGTTSSVDYSYTANSPPSGIPEISNPAPGSTLSGESVTFDLADNGAGVTNWRLMLGTTPGSSNLADSGILDASISSTTLSGLPTDGSTINATLLWLTGAVGVPPSQLAFTYTAAPVTGGVGGNPGVTAPVPGSTLSGDTETFNWTDDGEVVSDWQLLVGTSVGDNSLFDSGVLASTVLSAIVSGLPTDGSIVNVRLQYTISGTTSSVDYSYTANTPPSGIPEVSGPVPGSILTGDTETFSWTENGAVVSDWQLLVGTSVGDNSLFDSGVLASTVLSATVSGLPTDGSTVNVRLQYTISGTTSSVDYSYTANSPPSGIPEISNPAPGSILSGESVTFDLVDNGAGVTNWRLSLGTTPGSSNLADSGILDASVSSTTLSGLPTDGSTINVTLLWLTGAVGVPPNQLAFTYTAAASTGVGDPEVTAPVPGSTLSGDTETFNWTDDGEVVSDWQLLVGTSVGDNSLFDSGVLASTVLSAIVSGLPTDGSTVNVRLQYTISGTTSSVDYSYTANTPPSGIPEVSGPVPGSILTGDTETFNWTENGAVVSDWQLLVGTSVGDNSLFDSGVLASTVLSATVSGLPTDGSTVNVRLQYTISGTTSSVDYSYTANSPPSGIPEISNPAPGSTLSGESVTFDFVDNGAGVTLWRLLLGTTPGSSNLADSSILDASVSSTTLSGLPTDGSTINATLMWRTEAGVPASRLEFAYIAGEEVEDVQDPSVAKQWSEVLLDGIRGDFARPTMHSRNLWHISAAMYDAWAIYDDVASNYLLGRTVSGFTCDLNDSMTSVDIHLDREEALSYAAYRLISHRFATSPGADDTLAEADALMATLGYDATNTSIDTSANSPAALGNLIAQCYIDFGLQDGSNEINDFANNFYTPVNPDIHPNDPGNPNIIDLDRWQPISLPLFIDQSGNPVFGESIFLSPEWGQVVPFSLTDADKTTYQRDGFDYQVYHDPGSPPSAFGDSADDYKWGFALVAIWSGHLDPADGVMIDISPASLGNIGFYPTLWSEYPAFYDKLQGGDPSTGYTVNPVTGLPYEPQIVPRGDYARVLAEFWADGPESETPPGHWYTIVNTISEHPDLEKRIGGAGDTVGPLEWDIKVYFLLGGAMHDSAIAAWGMKGWYDYLRPVSAIRAMADRGQSSDPAGLSYSTEGIPLTSGYIELVEAGDPLAGDADENVGKIKLYAWRGPDYIVDPEVDVSGVGWILAENWWPYQRPTFVSPPFAGYVSGHSVFSRAAAEVLTSYTGSPYFPGGMSDFKAPQNEFLVFEEGPSVDITLQWATYRDASDQTSLSRIWGGIHPPVDDLPGRAIGESIAQDAYSLATGYFNGTN